MRLFESSGDYEAFLNVMGEAQNKVPIRCLAYCIMPNHFHLVLWPSTDDELRAFTSWLTMTHAKRWHVWHDSVGTGHVYQGRFRALPVSTDPHFLSVCRYVERNALTGGLVERAEEWRWSSLAQRMGEAAPVELAKWPVVRPDGWLDLVNLGSRAETSRIREAVKKGLPIGPDEWAAAIPAGLKPAVPGGKRGRDKKPTAGVEFETKTTAGVEFQD